MPAGWSRRRRRSASRRASSRRRAAALRGRRAGPLRRRDGGARRDAGAAAGGQRRRLHAARSRARRRWRRSSGTTRSAAALELWRDRLGGAVVAIGNAPTALFHLLEMLAARRAAAGGGDRDAGRLRRRGGVEGRRWRRPTVPCAIVAGRMGGSAMAAAAVNALARPGHMSGRLIGVGTGPGDPELLTLKAVRALAEADVVAHFAKAGHRGNARATVAGYLRPGVVELPLLYPVTTEIRAARAGLWRGDRGVLRRGGGRGRGASRRRAQRRGAERGRPAVLRLLHAPARAPGAALAGGGDPRRSPRCRAAGARPGCRWRRATTC